MKQALTLVIVSFMISGCLVSCSKNDTKHSELSEIQVYIIKETGDSLIFTSADIAWFNPKSRELRFKNPVIDNTDISLSTRNMEFRKNGLFLFRVDRLALCVDSKPSLDLVLYSAQSGKYYLNDCYPESDQFKNSPIVLQNAAARKDGWKIFLDTLKEEGRLKK